MTAVAERQYEHVGESSGCADHDYDIIRELSRRLDSLWRCDQHIANAKGNTELVTFWRDVKKQEESNVKKLKALLAGEIRANRF